jgi:hypothetical protein
MSITVLEGLKVGFRLDLMTFLGQVNKKKREILIFYHYFSVVNENLQKNLAKR